VRFVRRDIRVQIAQRETLLGLQEVSDFMKLSDRLRVIHPCSECKTSEGGNWAVDQQTGRQLAKRCHCLRGQLLAKADAVRLRGQAA
jgi:hypothetical protein